ncbi:MAG: dUTP diphosphatase [Paracoccaceae bacterium]
MKVNIKKLHEDAVIPKYAKPGDAGMDLTATWMEFDHERKIVTYGTGLAFEIPFWHVGLIYPRSSVYKTSMVLANHVGVIDAGYRGEIMFKYRVLNDDWQDIYDIGDRIGQIIITPYPKIDFVEVDKLTKTDRGEGGYGSTGS